MPTRPRLSLSLGFGSLLLATTRLFAAETTDGKVYTQLPEIAAAVTADDAAHAADTTPPAPNRSEPQPFWIWGADQDHKYILKKSFQGQAKTARLLATCDNRMTLYLNDRQVASSDAWEVPVDVDVQKFLREGENTLTAHVENQGGPAGFVLRLTLTSNDGQTQYISSDKTWQAADAETPDEFVAVRQLDRLGGGPWGDALSASRSIAGEFHVLPGFQVERLFTVPKEQLGSWVCLAVDPRGRLIVSDQEDKGLCRVTPPPLGSQDPVRVERLDVKISGAQGLLFAFDSLYVSVNGGPGSGLYRLKDTNGDDQFDEVVKLKELRGGGEHGPHALRLSPDGKSIYLICGNHTLPPADAIRNSPTQTMGGIRSQVLHAELPPGYTSRITPNWDEDQLLPRQWDANGHAVGILAPGGWIAKTDPDGKTWELVSIGYRNPYDMDFNDDGELFAYDADMEWDMGAPWYRPTRVVHATSGSEFGWRSGTGKWPAYYVDSLPQLVDIGPGSPVGVEFGRGTRFPARYQQALYICDWTFGTMYAIHIQPDGASYSAQKEEFLSRTPLPLTDVAVGKDGALYFTVGGRGAQSELFRVTYVGAEPTAAASGASEQAAGLRQLRHQIEDIQHHVSNGSRAVSFLLPHLSHADRHIRYAARVALEFQDLALWHEQVLQQSDPDALIQGSVALARQGDAADLASALDSLQRLDFAALDERRQLDLLRAYALLFIRLGAPDENTGLELATRLEPYYPAKSDALNRELCTLLVFLNSPVVASRTIELMRQPTHYAPDEMSDLLARNPGYGGSIASMLENHPESQKVHYAFALRNLRKHWTLDERVFYFTWLRDQHQKRGGASFGKFLDNIAQEAYENATDVERLAAEAAGAREPFKIPELPKAEGPGQDYSLADLLELSKTRLRARNFDNGKKMFGAARCVVCHRFQGDGGATGPDLTQAAGRFNLKDLSEAIVDPSKVVSDQYRTVIIETKDGQTYTGRIVSLSEDSLRILVDPEDATKVVTIALDDIEARQMSAVSLMPKDLLKTLNPNEVLDLLAYLLSRGNAQDPLFRP